MWRAQCAEVDHSGLARQRECSASISRWTRERAARWELFIWILHWFEGQMNRCFKGQDSGTVTDWGAWTEVHSCQLFSQGVPTTALGLTITLATCAAYMLWHQPKKRGKRCLVCCKGSFQITVRFRFLAIKTHMTLGRFFNTQKKVTRREKCLRQGIGCWLLKPARLAAAEGPKLNPCWWAKGCNHRQQAQGIPSCLEPGLPHMSGTVETYKPLAPAHDWHQSKAGKLPLWCW